jgi:hypothetical protein
MEKLILANNLPELQKILTINNRQEAIYISILHNKLDILENLLTTKEHKDYALLLATYNSNIPAIELCVLLGADKYFSAIQTSMNDGLFIGAGYVKRIRDFHHDPIKYHEILKKFPKLITTISDVELINKLVELYPDTINYTTLVKSANKV